VFFDDVGEVFLFGAGVGVEDAAVGADDVDDGEAPDAVRVSTPNVISTR
jgi:hypothetical protein